MGKIARLERGALLAQMRSLPRAMVVHLKNTTVKIGEGREVKVTCVSASLGSYLFINIYLHGLLTVYTLNSGGSGLV